MYNDIAHQSALALAVILAQHINVSDDCIRTPAGPFQMLQRRNSALLDSERESRLKPPNAICCGYHRHNQTTHVTIAQAPEYVSVNAPS
jgi:hypothetical protein